MELLRELFATAVLSALLSLIVAKLVSAATRSDADRGGDANLSAELGQGIVLEEKRLAGRLAVEGFESGSRVESVEYVVEEAVEYEDDRSLLIDQVPEQPGNRCELLSEECDRFPVESHQNHSDDIPGDAAGEVAELRADRPLRVEEILKPENRGQVIEQECGELPEKSPQKDPVNIELREARPSEECFIGERRAEVQDSSATATLVEGTGSDDQGVELRREPDARSEDIRVEKCGPEEEKRRLREDDDWEGIEKTELERTFAAAVRFASSADDKNDWLSSLGSEEQMELYALHKVATEGPCREPQPMALMFSARAKWNAWQRLGNMSPDAAMELYISFLSAKIPGWMDEVSMEKIRPDIFIEETPSTSETNFSKVSYHQPESKVERQLDLKNNIEKGGSQEGAGLADKDNE